MLPPTGNGGSVGGRRCAEPHARRAPPIWRKFYHRRAAVELPRDVALSGAHRAAYMHTPERSQGTDCADAARLVQFFEANAVTL